MTDVEEKDESNSVSNDEESNDRFNEYYHSIFNHRPIEETQDLEYAILKTANSRRSVWIPREVLQRTRPEMLRYYHELRTWYLINNKAIPHKKLRNNCRATYGDIVNTGTYSSRGNNSSKDNDVDMARWHVSSNCPNWVNPECYKVDNEVEDKEVWELLERYKKILSCRKEVNYFKK